VLLYVKDVPEGMLRNVSNQIRQVMPVPKTLEDYPIEERESFPRVFEWLVVRMM